MGISKADRLNKDARTGEWTPKLERCGNCGEFQSDPKGYTKEEQNNAELVLCGCEKKEDEQRYVTRDMAIDAGDLSLEGQPL